MRPTIIKSAYTALWNAGDSSRVQWLSIMPRSSAKLTCRYAATLSSSQSLIDRTSKKDEFESILNLNRQ